MARIYRWYIAVDLDFFFTAFYTISGTSKRKVVEDVISPSSENKRQETLKYMKKSTPEKYHSILLPRHHLGQKRRVFDTNYLSTLSRSNVFLTNDPISHLTSSSVITTSGKEYPTDIIILANGFHTQSFILPIKFSNSTRGITLDSTPETGVWHTSGPQAYLGPPPPPRPRPHANKPQGAVCPASQTSSS